MNALALRRRLVYIVAMVLLLIPIYVLGQPSVPSASSQKGSSGGVLAQLRSKYDLGQGDLGDIDPASESMRLATLGLRGVAATVLWQRAEYYKREQYWDRYSASLNQIAKLQPHFVKVWDFLSWNLSYNISIEFDDYRQRYAWVKKGIDYLQVGSKYNRHKTDLPYEVGWKFGNKFGVSDEKVQFRELFRQDNDWHKALNDGGMNEFGMDVYQQSGLGPDNRPDSWLTGKMWYERCYEMVRQGDVPCKSTTNFYRMGPMWALNFAQAIEAEGVLNDAAILAWKNGQENWKWFGDRFIRSTWGEDLRMNDVGFANDAVTKAREAFMEYCGDKYRELEELRRKELPAEQLQAYDTPDFDRTSQQMLLAIQARAALTVPYDEVVEALAEDRRFTAKELALRVREAEDLVQHIEIYRNQVNFTYWETRAIAEQSREAINARHDLYAANQLLNKGQLEEAEQMYESAWKHWDALFNLYPSMMLDDSAEEVQKAITTYRRKVIDGELPDNFILNDFLAFREEFNEGTADPRLTQALAEWSKIPNRGPWFERMRKAREAAMEAGRVQRAEMEANLPEGTPRIEMLELPLEETGTPAKPGTPPETDTPANPGTPASSPSGATESPAAIPSDDLPPAPASPAEATADAPPAAEGTPVPPSETTSDAAPAAEGTTEPAAADAPEEGNPPSPN
jgi:hypothetical protein